MTDQPVLPVPAPPAEARLAIYEKDAPTHLLSRRVVETADGRRFQLFTATPRQPAAEAGYPLLYMLDGNAAFDALTPETLALVPGLVLVGIGYDTELRFDRESRSLDYTPAAQGEPPRPDPQRPDRMIGGAGAFLERLQLDLVAQAETGLPIDPARRTLWGHSLAGMCVLFALLTRPGMFSRYVAVSPSLWWGDEFLLRLETDVPDGLPGPADVLIMLGDSERRSSPGGPHWDGPAPHTLEMIRRLRLRGGLKVSSRIFEGAGHAATLPASLVSTLEFAAG